MVLLYFSLIFLRQGFLLLSLQIVKMNFQRGSLFSNVLRKFLQRYLQSHQILLSQVLHSSDRSGKIIIFCSGLVRDKTYTILITLANNSFELSSPTYRYKATYTHTHMYTYRRIKSIFHDFIERFSGFKRTNYAYIFIIDNETLAIEIAIMFIVRNVDRKRPVIDRNVTTHEFILARKLLTFASNIIALSPS